jgi:hypothetical protein
VTLTTLPRPDQKFVLCIFELFDYAVSSGFSDVIGPEITLKFPDLVYYPLIPTLSSSSSICSDSRITGSDCLLTFTFPTIALPSTFETTSLAILTGCSVPIRIDRQGTIIGDGPLGVISRGKPFAVGPDGPIILYSFQFYAIRAAELPSIITCQANIAKSILSPYLHLVSNGVIIREYQAVLYTDIRILPDLATCYSRSTSTCILRFDILKSTPDKSFTVAFDGYFTTPPNSPPPTPCNDGSLSDRPNTHELYCQTFQKSFHDNDHRNSLGPEVNALLTGRFFQANIPVQLGAVSNGIIFDRPILHDWDETICADINSPTCVLKITSYYTGPPIQLHFDLFPFETQFDRVLCSSSQMSIGRTTGWTVYLPGHDAPNVSPNQWVVKEDTWPMTCEISFLIQYRHTYNYQGLQTKLIRFTQYPIIDYRENLQTAMNIDLIGGSSVQYTKFPFQIEELPNCSNPDIHECTLRFNSKFDPLALTNHPRSFGIHIPGADPNYLIQFPSYTLTYTNFVHIVMTHSIQMLAAENGPFSTTVPYFAVEIASNAEDKDFYIDNTTNAYFELTFKKLIDSNYARDADPALSTLSTPYWVSYAGGFLTDTTQPIDFYDTNNPNGLEIVFLPYTSATFGDDCEDSLSLYCSVHLTRRGGFDKTWFTAVSIDTATESPVNAIGGFDSFRTADLQPLADLKFGLLGTEPCVVLEWTAFKSGLEDPIPTQGIVKFTKGPNTYDDLIINVFKPNDDITLVEYSFILRQKTAFSVDVLPVYGEDCGAYTTATCTADYIINNDVPPNWDIIAHPLPTGAIHSIVSETDVVADRTANLSLKYEVQTVCSNTVAVSSESGGTEFQKVIFRFYKLETAIPGVVKKLLEPQLPDGFVYPRVDSYTWPLNDPNGVVIPSDFISLSNTNGQQIQRADRTKPMICRIQYALHNVISKPRHRLVPIVLHDKVLNHYRGDSVFIPQMGWTPIIVENDPSCTTVQLRKYVYGDYDFQLCHLKASFYGSPRFPMNGLWYVTRADDTYHPLIPNFANYHFYEEKHDVPPLILNATYSKIGIKGENGPMAVTKAIWGQPQFAKVLPQSDWAGCLGLWAYTGPGAVEGMRVFNFTTRPENAYKHFSGWVTFGTPIVDRVPGMENFPIPGWVSKYTSFATPPTQIPLLLNAKVGWTLPMFTIPPMTYSRTISMALNQTSFEVPGMSILRLTSRVKLWHGYLDTDFGFRTPMPCVSTASPDYKEGSMISYADYLALAQLPIEAHDAHLMALQNQTVPGLRASDPPAFIDPGPRMPPLPFQRVLGWWVPEIANTVIPRNGTMLKTVQEYRMAWKPNESWYSPPFGTALGAINQDCMTYVPISHVYPSKREEVKFTFQLYEMKDLGFGIINFYSHHTFPSVVPTARLLAAPVAQDQK